MPNCVLCKSDAEDLIRYGEFVTSGKTSAHTFCLYLTSNLCQKGEEHEGLIGFLENDIAKEIKRIGEQRCCYCKKNYANISCCDRKCRRSFHLICGIENGAENEFCDTYKSFCGKHRRKIKERPEPHEICCICSDDLLKPGERISSVELLHAPCCRNGWFHKICLMKLAKSSGYFLKCPLCNNKDEFRTRLRFRGIFIPDRDAEWETTPNAYAELLERPDTCMASICKNRKGRSYFTFDNILLLCNTCGSSSIHQLCSVTPLSRIYICTDCRPIVDPWKPFEVGATVVTAESESDSEGSLVSELMDIVNVVDDTNSEHNLDDTDIIQPVRLRARGMIIVDDSSNDISIVDFADETNLDISVSSNLNELQLKFDKNEDTTDGSESPITHPYRRAMVIRDEYSSDEEGFTNDLNESCIASRTRRSHRLRLNKKVEANIPDYRASEMIIVDDSSNDKSIIDFADKTNLDISVSSNVNELQLKFEKNEDTTDGSDSPITHPYRRAMVIRDEYSSDEEGVTNDLNESCIASRTRRSHCLRLNKKVEVNMPDYRASTSNQSENPASTALCEARHCSNATPSGTFIANRNRRSERIRKANNLNLNKEVIGEDEKSISFIETESFQGCRTSTNAANSQRRPRNHDGAASCSNGLSEAHKPAKRRMFVNTATNNFDSSLIPQFRLTNDKQSNENSTPRQPLIENAPPRGNQTRRYV